MSLLTSLVTQIAQNAIQNKMQGGQAPTHMNQGGLGGLGGMFGGSSAAQQNGFGLDDVLGGLMRGGMGGGMNSGLGGGMGGSMGGGMLGQVLGSVLGGGMGGGLGGGMGSGFGNSVGQSRGGFGGKGMLMAALLPIVLMFIQRNGGLAGTLDKVRNMGFGEQANTWMGTGENAGIDPNSVSQLFDQQDIEQVAQQTGADTQEVRQGLAELLPQVMDNLTPNGNLDTDGEANNEINEILSQLSQFRR